MKTYLIRLALALTLLASTSAAGDVRFTFRGSVIQASNPTGAYTGVQVNDPVVLTCDVFTVNPPPVVIAPGQFVRYTIDAPTMAMSLGAINVSYEAGAPVLAVQNDFPVADGIGRSPDITATLGGKTVEYGFGHNGSLLVSIDPFENLGTHAITPDSFFSFTWVVTGGGTFIEIFPTDMTIELIPNGTVFCAGDGTGTACPCSNHSAPGDGVGCLSSFGQGAKLRAFGSSSSTGDTLLLQGSQMPDSPCLYFQGSAQQSGGAGALFGDGLRCAGGSVRRLGIETNLSGSSQFPGPGDPSISTQGGITGAGTFHYQVWYRNTATFCTPAGFNLSNGVSIVWS